MIDDFDLGSAEEYYADVIQWQNPGLPNRLWEFEPPHLLHNMAPSSKEGHQPLKLEM